METGRGRARGFTLVEMMISGLILMFIFAAVLAVLKAGDSVFHFDSAQLDLQQEARKAADVMGRELRQSSPARVAVASDGQRIDFRLPVNITADPVVYSANISYYLNGNRLVREHPSGTTDVIANNITSVFFCCRDDDSCGSSCADARFVEVTLCTGKTVWQRNLTYSLREKLRMRNND